MNADGSDPNQQRQRVLELVSRHGWNVTAFQTLESGYSYAFYGDDACVAYVDTGSAWVVAGAPIAPHEQIAEVAFSLLRDARAAGKRCCFFAAEERLLTAAGRALLSFAIGEQPVWDPRDWPQILEQSRSLRAQLRRAEAKDVHTRELLPHELAAGAARDGVMRVAERLSRGAQWYQ